MAPSLGKRKRTTRKELEKPSRSPSPSSSSSDAEDVQAIFQRAFEARFTPLDVSSKKPKTIHANIPDNSESESEPESDSDWSGLSSDNENGHEDEAPNTIQVISYANPSHPHIQTTKSELRAFMSSKPPSSSASHQPVPSATTSTSTSKQAAAATDPTETSHLKNDLALQRLLRDSHLLSRTSTSSSASASASASTTTSRSGTSTPTLTGALRHKSTDLALLSLGAKKSIHVQKNMPMALRKGLAAKAKQREEKRRADARDAGIVLEREVRVGKNGDGRGGSRSARGRDKGVGGPSVGRFQGGMLKLSRRDVADITGGGGGGGGSRGKGKGRRGR
ncbi:hypothetical protein K491DRAFT_756853 [Lophiostoma macrostomum CBS 122681]|uniref:Protein FAF1 n=1 Tax=Lophiostoma macrostomum CBS 122681 TaxID=1314788 RepID=A0A6A6TEJ4_9PLEO|nr:hypothetical protein K491DRAFT_756853 [Lophiostoma macrostomum CBS 122681]